MNLKTLTIMALLGAFTVSADQLFDQEDGPARRLLQRNNNNNNRGNKNKTQGGASTRKKGWTGAGEKHKNDRTQMDGANGRKRKARKGRSGRKGGKGFKVAAKQVFAVLDPKKSNERDLAWQYYHTNGQEATQEEYDTWRDYQEFLWNGGEEPKEGTPEYEEGDTEEDEAEIDDGPDDGAGMDESHWHMGCWNDCQGKKKGNGFRLKLGNRFSPAQCFEEARKEGFKYAAMAAGKQCFASNTLDESKFIDNKKCNQPCKKDKSMDCGAKKAKCTKSVYQLGDLNGVGPVVCGRNQIPDGRGCKDVQQCGDNEVQDNDGNCHPREDFALREMKDAGRETWSAIMRFEDATRRVWRMERELDRARVEMDMVFDPACGMKEVRDRDGGCRRCPGTSVQGDQGEDCIRVGAQVVDDFGNQYMGMTRNGNFEGKGEFRWKQDGDRYIGYFMNNKPEGFGKKHFKSGNVYEGEFREGRMEPVGSFTYKSGRRYEGGFRDGKFSGNGSLYWPDGTYIQGMFDNDEVNGFATKHFNDGSRYEGEWVNGFENGYGSFTSATNPDNNYMGQWRDGKRAN